MKKLEKIVVVLSVFLILAFANKEISPSVGYSPGSQFPSFQIADSVHNVSISDSQMYDYTLVYSWATYDAFSRANNVSYDRILRAAAFRTRMISVSFDTYSVLFKETARLDGLTPAWHFYGGDRSSKLYKKLNGKFGFTSYLINAEGVIIAKNFTPEELALLLKRES